MRVEGALRTLVTAVLVLAVNVVLDIALDLPVLVRWAVVLSVVLLVTVSFEAVRRRADAAGPARNRTQGSAHGRHPTR